MFKILWILLGICWTCIGHSFPGAPAFLKGEVFDKDSKQKLFEYVRTQEEALDGTISVDRTFTYPDGRKAVDEYVLYKNGRSQKYAIKQYQTNEEGFFEVKGNKIIYSYTRNGSTKTNEEKFEDNFTSVDEVVPTIHKNWDKLMRGEDVEIRLAILDRRESIKFKIFKIDPVERDGKKWTVLKMKISNFLLSVLVDPVYFYADPEGEHHVHEVDGRMTPKKEFKGSFKDLDALLKVYWASS